MLLGGTFEKRQCRTASHHVELLVQVGLAADQCPKHVELRRRGLVVVRDDKRSDALGSLVDEEHARLVERLDLIEASLQVLERGTGLVQAPEKDADDHSSGSAHGS